MKECEEHEALMERLMAGEPIDRLEEFLQHAGECPSCGDLLKFHEWLEAAAPGLDQPDAEGLARVRRLVMDRIAEEAVTAGAATPPRRGSAARARLRTAVLAAAATILVAAGIGIGRLLAPGAGPAGSDLRAPEAATGPAETLRSLAASPYVFSNVTVEPLGREEVRLGFDVTRRVEVARSKGDPIVREALIYALRGATPLDGRLRAVDLAGAMADGEVRSALIAAMEGDPSVAVRLQALSALSRIPSEPAITDAMLRILRREPNVQMRLLAVDYLGASHIRPERVREALRTTPSEGSQAVLRLAGKQFGI